MSPSLSQPLPASLRLCASASEHSPGSVEKNQMGRVCLESSLKNAKSSSSVQSEKSLRISGLLPVSFHENGAENGSGRRCRPVQLVQWGGTAALPLVPELFADRFLSATLGWKGAVPGSVANTLSSRGVRSRGRQTMNGSCNTSRRPGHGENEDGRWGGSARGGSWGC